MTFDIIDEIKNKSGVYVITNTINNKKYVGSAVNLWKRYIKHRAELLSNKHHNSKLQRAANKYNLLSFNFSLLELCDKDNLIAKEQYWIDDLHVVKSGYNFAPIAGSALGQIRSNKVRKKLSIAAIERAKNPEYIEKLRAANKGKVPSEKTRQAAAIKNKGSKQSKETIEKRVNSIKATRAPNIKKVTIVCKNCNKQFYDYHDTQHGERMFCSKKCANTYNCEEVLQYDLSGVLIHIYRNVSECSKQTGISRKAIVARCVGVIKKIDNYVFKFSNEENSLKYFNKANCIYCNNTFSYYKYYSQNERKFCSKKCNIKYQGKLIEKKIDKICPVCNNEFRNYEHIVCCSKNCAGKHQHSKVKLLPNT